MSDRQGPADAARSDAGAAWTPPPPPVPSVELIGVSKWFGDIVAVSDVSFSVGPGVTALLDLKPAIDAWMASLGWECQLTMRAHVGEVIAGDFGGRFDVIGAEVNTAAMLDHTGLALSVAAFRSLSPELRKRFKKHTAPITYIRTEDPHRLRWDKR